jgi:hypothetical protein
MDYLFNEIIEPLLKEESVTKLEYFFRTDRSFQAKVGTYNSMISEGKSSIISNRSLFGKIQNIYQLDVKSLRGIGDGI